MPGRVVDLLCASLLRDFFFSSLGSLGKGVRLFQGGAVFYIHFERSGVCGELSNQVQRPVKMYFIRCPPL